MTVALIAIALLAAYLILAADTIGLGTILKVNDGSSGAQTEILYVVGMTPPAPLIQYTDARFWNQGNRLLKFKPVATDPGKWSFTVKYDSTERARMIALQILTLNATCPIFQILWTDSVTHTIDSWVEKVGNVVTIDAINQYTVELQANSLITVA